MSLFSLLVLFILPFSDSFVFDPELTDRLDEIIQNQVCSKMNPPISFKILKILKNGCLCVRYRLSR